MLGRSVWLLAVALVGLGCTFDKSALDLGQPDAAPDGAPPADAPGEGGGSCVEGQAQCSGSALLVCELGQYRTHPCPLGCNLNERRCYAFTAANVQDGDLGRGDTDLLIDRAGNYTLDVDTGKLTFIPAAPDPPEPVDFPTGVVPATEAQAAGNPDLFVLRVRDFLVGPNTRLAVLGTRALVVLASGEISIDGILEVSASGSTGGPGGYDGGGRGGAGSGPGGGGGGENGGSLGTSSGGGGGGGSGANGGAGGLGGTSDAISPPVGPAAGGAGTTDRTLHPLHGGSGGGGGSAAGDNGGGGGGALQLSAATAIQVWGSIIAVGGGGGRGKATGTDFGAGSGGGGGGAVLLEAPVINVVGYIAFGGGGGGGAGGDAASPTDGAAGQPGQPNGVAAAGGGPGHSSEGGGGAGGAAGAAAAAGGAGGWNGGGGGGAAGRALFATSTGQASLSAGLSPTESGGLTAESVLAKH
jgi:hypothetical protein